MQGKIFLINLRPKMILYDIFRNPKKNVRGVLIISIFLCIIIITIFIAINFMQDKRNLNLEKNNLILEKDKSVNKKSSIKSLLKVQTTQVISKDMPIYINAIGTIIASESVTVKAKLNGELTKVLFTEGEFVKKGDILAELDDRSYKAQYTQYQGQLNRDLALLNNAKLDLSRYKNLFPAGGISKQTLDTQVSLVKQYEGIVEFDRGQLETIKVNLAHCKITAPISGKAGLRLVNPGNYVQFSDQSGIVVINKMQPISAIFSISQEYLPIMLKKLNQQDALKVFAYDKENKEILAIGKLNTIDNQIDTATGTIKLRAEFENAELKLFPNQFTNIKLLLENKENALIIPISAIQYGKNGTYVYTREQNKAKYRQVILSEKDGDNVAIREGLNLGEHVIIDGLDKLTDGAELSP